jgi:hypothetical protein
MKTLKLTNSQTLSLLWAIERTEMAMENYTEEEYISFGFGPDIKNLEFIKDLLSE